MKNTLLILLATITAASAQNLIVNGNFETGTAGSIPAKPWMVPSQVKEGSSVSVTLEPLPGSPDEKLWVRLHDQDPALATSMVQSFTPVKNGRLSLKVYFQTLGTAFGIYLGSEKVSGPETRVIDFKVLSKGRMSLGDAGTRSKSEFSFTEGKIYSLYFDFKTSEDGTKVSYDVGLEDTGEVIGSSEVDARLPIAGLRINIDSKDARTDVYVTDISLVAKE